MRTVAVFDTNILLSGIGWHGSPYQCLELARSGKVEGLTCRELLWELTPKLEGKLRFSPSQVTDTIADLLCFLRLVAIRGTLRAVVADPGDDKVIECAVIGKATHIVTGDRRHLLPLHSYQGIAIVSASDFLTAVSDSRQPPND